MSGCHVEAVWDDLVKSALLGTERQPADLAPPDGALEPTFAALHAAEPERALLSAAAVTGVYRRAGWTPPVDVAVLPAPAPPETLRPCPPAAAHHLWTMLAGQHQDALPEWLRALAARGLRAPRAALPSLLDLGRRACDLQPDIRPVLGERGEWLARRQPGWTWAVRPDDSEWETGSIEARVEVLRRWRATDPERAREQLAAAWPAEPPEHRRALLPVLEIGLGPADEPLLESALDDRRAEVRRLAADLLRRFPESGLVRRLTDRALRHVTLRATPHGPAGSTEAVAVAIEVTLPEACDEAMCRDGVTPDPAVPARAGAVGGLIGERAWWLRELIAAVPPGTWCRHSGAPPEAIVRAALDHEYAYPLLDGWRVATLRHRDPDWAWALLSVRSAIHQEPMPASTLLGWALFELVTSRQPGTGRQAARAGGQTANDASALYWLDQPLAELIDVLPDERRDNYLLETLIDHPEPLAPRHFALPLLQHARRPWRPELTRAVATHLVVHAHQGGFHYLWQLEGALRAFALAMAPMPVDQATNGWRQPDEAPPVLRRLVWLLEFRHAMYRALDEDADEDRG